MNINEEYYVLVASNNDDYPLLSWGDTKKVPLREINDIYDINLIFDDPVPDSPKLVDYHILPRPVISSKIKNALEKLKIEGVQYIPATITSKSNKKYENFFLLHIFNLIKCLDLKKSNFDYDEDSDTVDDLRSFLLDEKALSEMPLNIRLVFILREWPSIYICHKTIMEAILSVNPTGIRFIPISDWNDDINFN